MAKKHGFGDLENSIQEARDEQEEERNPPYVPTLRVPRFNAEGLLLNPGEFQVSSDGVTTGKVM